MFFPSSPPDFKAARCHRVTKKGKRQENEGIHSWLLVSRAGIQREKHEREGGTFVIFLSEGIAWDMHIVHDINVSMGVSDCSSIERGFM